MFTKEKQAENIKDNKAPTHDNGYEDLLKMVEDEYLHSVTELFNRIFRTEKIPRDYLISI